MKIVIIFALSLIVTNLCYAVNCLRRIAEALEDYVYDDEDEEADVEESEVAK